MKPPKTQRHELSPARKNKFIGAVIAGKSIAQAARLFDIKDPTARSIWKKYEKTGSAENLALWSS
jgi:transposase